MKLSNTMQHYLPREKSPPLVMFPCLVVLYIAFYFLCSFALIILLQCLITMGQSFGGKELYCFVYLGGRLVAGVSVCVYKRQLEYMPLNSWI